MGEILQGESLINEIKKSLRPAINGVDELTLWLESTLCPFHTANSSNNAEANNEYFRLFKHGQIESIIRVHTGENPSQIKMWYGDLVNRPAPDVVKCAVHTFFNIFFSNVFKPNESPFFDAYLNNKEQLLHNTFFVNNAILPHDRETAVIKNLLKEKPESCNINGVTGVYQHENAIQANHNATDQPTAEKTTKKILVKSGQ